MEKENLEELPRSIPHTIHYCWFGKGEQSNVLKTCIDSWRKTCPDFDIKLWNEENYDVNTHPFTKKMYADGHFAFVSDFARLEILEKEGGFYLDTDMLLLQSLDHLTHYSCVLGKESPSIISAGMIGATKNHPFIQQAYNHYIKTDPEKVVTIPRVLTDLYNSYEDKKSLHVTPPHVFYPFDSNTIHTYKGQDLGKEVYGVHLWNYSWGHPLNKFFKKIGIYTTGKKIVEFLGIKSLLKKILGFI